MGDTRFNMNIVVVIGADRRADLAARVGVQAAENTPHAIRAPLLPDGSVIRSSAAACTTSAEPSASSSPASVAPGMVMPSVPR